MRKKLVYNSNWDLGTSKQAYAAFTSYLFL